ncbi:MAG: hypothetical protein KC561_13310, partial [Myxococcales bacterium]|nr:hypothetical protein [Myxococcales bacterium]
TDQVDLPPPPPKAPPEVSSVSVQAPKPAEATPPPPPQAPPAVARKKILRKTNEASRAMGRVVPSANRVRAFRGLDFDDDQSLTTLLNELAKAG